jgi:hypothetical protein
VILGLIILIGSPPDMNALARFLIPEGLGIVAGTLARRIVNEEVARSMP